MHFLQAPLHGDSQHAAARTLDDIARIVVAATNSGAKPARTKLGTRESVPQWHPPLHGSAHSSVCTIRVGAVTFAPWLTGSKSAVFPRLAPQAHFLAF